ncbi:MAG: type II secretion system F family protein [Proteobacteria bacterium]|nr:type II secretion system F family protein [Pseudomonadota bacterium]
MPASQVFAMLSILLTVVAAMMFGVGFFPDETYKGPVPERGYLMNKRNQLIRNSPLYRILNKVLMVFAYWSEKMPISKVRNGLSVRLARAGHLGGFTGDEFMAFCVVSMLFFFFLCFFFMQSVTGEARLPLCFVAGMFGAYFPIMYLDEQVMQRLTQINRDLPYMLDVLALSVGAGLDFNSSLERIVTKDSTQSPLVEEMRYVLQEVKMGTTRREALLGLKDRVPSDYITGLVSSVVQAEQMGTPLTNILRIQAGAIRLKRSQRAEKLAGEAPVKMIMPLLFIVGAVMLTLFGAIIIKAVRGELF